MDNESSQQSVGNPLTLYLDILRRRQAIVIQTFIVVLAVGIIVTFLTKPLYLASTSILVEGQAMVVTTLDPGNPLSNLFSSGSGHSVDTQLEVIQGKQVLEDTYKEAGLPAGSVTLDAKQYGATDIINITTTSNVRDYAQKFANTLPIVYRRYVTGNRSTEIKNALAFARNRLKTENAALSSAESALQAFHQRSHIASLETEQTQRTTQQVTVEANRDKDVVALSGIQARLNDLIAQRKALHPEIVNPSATTNPAIQTMQDQIANLKLERDKMLLLYKPGSLEIQQLDLQIQKLQARLAKIPAMLTSVSRVNNPEVAAFDEKIAQARTEIAESQARLKNTERIVSGGSQDMDKYIVLERQQGRLARDIERYESSIALLTKSVDDLSLRAQATHDPVLVISPADRAEQIAPRRINNLLIAAVAGLVLALVFALIQELIDDGITSPDESRRIMGAPALGFIPLIDEQDKILLGSSPGGTVLETYRVLRTNVRFSSVDNPIHSIAITSTLSGEGKSVTAHNLAVAMALDGRRVIIVDADLRRPSQHKFNHLDRSPGLTNVLVGNMELERVLQSTDIDNLRVVTTGPLPPNPTELLSSQAMSKFHEEIKEHCDIVIFDCPPCLVAADAQILASSVDGVLYVAQFGVTKRSLMRRSSELLQQAQSRILGVVFNKIDLRSGRDDYYYGYYRYYKYYRNDADTLGVESSDKRRRSYREFEALLQADRSDDEPQAEMAAAGEHAPSAAERENSKETS